MADGGPGGRGGAAGEEVTLGGAPASSRAPAGDAGTAEGKNRVPFSSAVPSRWSAVNDKEGGLRREGEACGEGRCGVDGGDEQAVGNEKEGGPTWRSAKAVVGMGESMNGRDER